jgi:5-(carboxyamino)imidazole ribonucleotide synthase
MRTMPELAQPVAPGGTVGILGGGQLARMLSIAAARMGLKVVVFAPDRDSPAFQVAGAHVVAAYDDRAALQGFARQVDVITYEFENIPGDTGAFLASLKPVRPNPQALAVIQNRIGEKSFVQKLGIGTTPFAAVTSEESARAAFGTIGAPAVLKTSRLGYDGKGQCMVRAAEDVITGWRAFGGVECILEGFVDFKRELSVVAARGADGTVACYDIVENLHGDHILRTTLAPAKGPQRLKAEANKIASRLLEAFDYVGVMAVELFETQDGRLLVNEMAPRVHNSGHWTIDGCTVSQFEQHIRAVCGWPMGDATRHSDAVMTNLLGDEVTAWRAHAAQPATAVHLYGKTDARQGRKMGHVTRLYPLGTRPDA